MNDGHISLYGFENAVYVKPLGKLPKNPVGSLSRMAPEMLEKKPYRFSVDWWAFGILLFECTFGIVPSFDLYKKDSEAFVFPTKHYETTANVPESFSRNDLYLRLLEPEVKHRIGSSNDGLGFEKDIKLHPWFSSIDWKSIESKTIVPIKLVVF